MKNDIYASVATAMEHNLESRKLIKKIVHAAEHMEIDMKASAFGTNYDMVCKVISELSGVHLAHEMRSITKFGGGCVESTTQTRYKYQNCQEVYFSLMYPTISLNEYGDMQFGEYSLGDFIRCLFGARKLSKTFANHSVSGKIKYMINMLFGFISRSELEWADEYTKGVPATGRRLISELTDALYGVCDVYPIYVNTDTVIITSLHEQNDLSEVLGMFDGYKIFTEKLNGDVVIFDRTKYIVGKAERFATIHKSEARKQTLTRATQTLLNSVKGQL